MDCVIGIDGGGTRSMALCVGLNGAVLARAEGGPLNYNANTLDDFHRNLGELIQLLRDQAARASVLRYVIGTAALFDHGTEQDTQRACAGVLPHANTCLLGDALVAVYGATGGRPGLLVISGTGSIAISMTGANQFRTAGGFGPLIGGDPGSAFWIASQSLLSAARAGASAPLTRAICQYFQVADLHDVIAPVYHQRDGCRRLAGLTGFLAASELAVQSPFLEIQQRAGHELAHMTRPLFTGELKTVQIVYGAGSVLQNNAIVREALQVELSKALGRDISVQAPELTAAAGAALLALEQVGATVTESIRRGLRGI